MWRPAILLVALALPNVQSLAREAVVGRWDIVIQKPGATGPSWLEIRPSGRSALVGRMVGEVGSARPISRIDFANGTIRFAIPPQWEQGESDLTFTGTLQGNQLSGSVTYPDGKQFAWTGKRAPALRRTAPPQWGAAIRLFTGKVAEAEKELAALRDVTKKIPAEAMLFTTPVSVALKVADEGQDLLHGGVLRKFAREVLDPFQMSWYRYALFPVAPPRLTDLPVVDTMSMPPPPATLSR